jgi:hypothetical protein
VCLNETLLQGRMQGKLAAVGKAKQGQLDGLEGGRTTEEPDDTALYVNPYDAGAASEGTQEIPTHGIPSPHHSPRPALSLDSAAALTPINDVVKKKSSEAALRCKFREGNGTQQMEQCSEQE